MKTWHAPWLAPIIIVALASSGCGPAYTLFNRQEVDSTRAELRELTALREHDPVAFVSKLKPYAAYGIDMNDQLGFGYTLVWGSFRIARHFLIEAQIIHLRDSVISYWGGACTVLEDGPGYTAYSSMLSEFEWCTHADMVSYNCRTTIQPVPDATGERLPRNPRFDSLMSPYFGTSIGGATTIWRLLEARKDGLSDDDVFYLLHSMNPATRALVMHHVRCSGMAVSSRTRTRIEQLIATSPNLVVFEGCVQMNKSVANFIACDQ